MIILPWCFNPRRLQTSKNVVIMFCVSFLAVVKLHSLLMPSRASTKVCLNVTSFWLILYSGYVLTERLTVVSLCIKVYIHIYK